MCGSGTIAIEAAMMARGIPPGLERRFAFERWPGFDASLWRAMVEAARERITVRAPAPILASDRDAGAIEATADNARRAGVLDDLTIERRSLSAAEPPAGRVTASGRPTTSGSHAAGGIGWIVTNPPYGVRVGERAPLRDLYARLGQVARKRFPGWTLAILSADPVLERQLGLALDVCIRTTNGGIPVHVARGRIPT
jgi:putative N6-adenine-specific DNA methylase